MTEETLRRRIQNTVMEGLRQWNIPSAAYGVIKDGHILLAEGYGFRDEELQLPADSDTVYMIGSCTKAFTSAMIAKLVDEGKLAWDVPVREYMPEIRFFDDYTTANVTIRDLLCHRTGMPRHEWSWYKTAFTREEIVANLRYLEPNAAFRSKYQYFNQGFLLAGCLIERITGKSYEECIEEMLFRPLGMTHSSITKAALENDPKGAKPYMSDDCLDLNGPYQRCSIYRSKAESLGRTQSDPIAPAGMVNSTVNDMLKWVQFHLSDGVAAGKQVISRACMEEMHAPQVVVSTASCNPRRPDNPDGDIAIATSYAMAWGTDVYRGHKHVHHGGNIDGFSALTSFVPDLQLGIVLYVNLDSFYGRYDIEHRIIDAVLNVSDVDWTERYMTAMNCRAEQAKKKAPSFLGQRIRGTAPTLEAGEYVGTYLHKGYEPVEIRQQGKKLLLLLADMELPLKHFHYDSFTVKSNNPDLSGDTPLVFGLGRNGHVNTLSIRLNEEAGTDFVTFQKIK